ncbi:unnamed protein product [Adineta steineri]|uniref:Uncharacterized protein n=1 Tax=Adineta steineri TaxID=433720 RepID=A0A814H9T3_9BILA|nr:unnamed protein product [Adineta steineri]CAF1007878.1 unnamed protein product [Adineta steineri]CAF1017179.1 unnamed protein product [Adineta steineri]
MIDTTHFQVQGQNNNDSDKIDIHFRNVADNKAVNILKNGFVEGIQQMECARQLSEIQVYRKAILDEAKEVLQNGAFGFDSKRPEKWISESFKKVLSFQNEIVPIENRSNERILQLTLNKKGYQQFRNNTIPQFRSKGSGQSVYNYEGIEGGAPASKSSTVPTDVPRNIGIRNTEIDKFDKTIKSVSILDPEDPFVKNQFLRYLSEHKLESTMTAISVIYEGYQILMALMDKNGQTLKKLVIQITNLVVNKIGSLITTALTSLMPAMGGFALGILGGLIFGFIGNKLGEMFFSIHSRVAPGEGPPISDYFSFIYGTNNCFGEPLNEYSLEQLLTAPRSEYSNIIQAVAFQQPTNDHDNQFIQIAFGKPK